jgi:hypothetical protein
VKRMAITRLAKKCRECPFVETCDNKYFEAYATLPPEDRLEGLRPKVIIVDESWMSKNPNLNRSLITPEFIESVGDKLQEKINDAIYANIYLGIDLASGKDMTGRK